MKFQLNGSHTISLWDTGAQMSIISKQTLTELCPESCLRSIAELIDGELNLSAANGSDISYNGWTEIEFQLSNSTKHDPVIQVPFLVTESPMEHPIIGYNVIEEVLKPNNSIHNQPSKYPVNLQAARATFET